MQTTRARTRTKRGMLRKAKQKEADRMCMALLDCIRQKRAEGHYSQESLDFWERRLWRWVDDAKAHRRDRLDLDPETWAAVNETMLTLGAGKVRVADDTYHATRRFMLGAIKAVCDAIVRGRGDGPEYWRESMERIFCWWTLDVRFRRKTEEETAADSVLREAYRHTSPTPKGEGKSVGLDDGDVKAT